MKSSSGVCASSPQKEISYVISLSPHKFTTKLLMYIKPYQLQECVTANAWGPANPMSLEGHGAHASDEPLTLFLRSYCFSAAGRSCHHDMWQTDISVADHTNWN